MKPTDLIAEANVTEQRLVELLKALRERVNTEGWCPWLLRMTREDQKTIQTLLDNYVLLTPRAQLMYAFSKLRGKRTWLLPEEFRFICNLVLEKHFNFVALVGLEDSREALMSFFDYVVPAKINGDYCEDRAEAAEDGSLEDDGFRVLMYAHLTVEALRQPGFAYDDATRLTQGFFHALFTLCARHLPEDRVWEIYDELGSLFTE